MRNGALWRPAGRIFNVAVLLAALVGASLATRAQEAVPPPMPAYQPLSDEQLDQLLGPIALYPDPLIAVILPASTFPTDIVLADRYVSGGGDPNAIDQQPWDASVQALARYPDLLQWLDQNLEWTTEVGQAFLNQPQDVMDSIQRLRAEAYNLGNLQSTPQEQVVQDNGDIEILPAGPDVMYVPVYQPAEVYYQSGFGISFGVGCPIGVWLDWDFDWHNHHLFTWDRAHPRPPDWWRERPAQRDAIISRQTAFWHPEDHRSAFAVNQGDRGWNNPPPARPPRQQTVTVIGQSGNRPEPSGRFVVTTPGNRPETRPSQPQPVTIIGQSAHQPRPTAVPNRPAPAPAQHYQISNPTSTGAFIGIQSAQQTRDYSNRGRQSMGAVTHSAPPARSAPVSRPAPYSGGSNRSAGGEGSHGGGSPPRR